MSASQPLLGFGAAPVPGLVWTARGNIAAGSGIFAIGAGGGVALAVDQTGKVWKSTDGGHTWNNISTVPVTARGTGGNIAQGQAGVWIYGGAGTHIARSTDGGNTWTDIAIAVGTGGTGHVTTDGAGTWILNTNILNNNPPAFARSIDNGATWTPANPFNGQASGVPAYWDGAQFMAANTDVGPTVVDIWTSPDGVAANWTAHQTVNNFSGPMTKLAGEYAQAISFASVVANGNSVVNLAADVGQNAHIGGSLSAIVSGGTKFFVFDSGGGVAHSADAGASWHAGTLNFPGGQGCTGQGGSVAYDSVNDSFIAGSTGGNISTFP